ncbi:MAG: nucleotide exchange factor GrpE [Thermoanaerobaculia bacterium]|nr:nucleotide exchange factor GrpE [Thermoanaerobaculia bacterium]
MTEPNEKDQSKESGSYELSLDDTLVRLPEEGMDALYEDAVEAVERRRKPKDDEDPVSADETSGDESAEESNAEAPEMSQAAAENAEMLRDRLVRTIADFDNFRKRTDREKADVRRQAAGSVLREILEVVDNLERALSASGKLDELKQGVEMILRQQVDILRRHGVERVESVGQPFDPNLHEAVAREEGDADLDVPTVATEMQAGYRHHDRLLRPAMVTVAVPPAKPKVDVREVVAEGTTGDNEDVDFDYDDENTVIGIDV